jgi:hypothetical protein
MKFTARLRFEGPCHPNGPGESPWWLAQWHKRREEPMAQFDLLMQCFQWWYHNTPWEVRG